MVRGHEVELTNENRYFRGDMPQKEMDEGAGASFGGPVADSEQWLTPAEVAALFGVHPKTVTRWAKGRRLGFIRTLGGHRRYRLSDVRKLLSEETSAGLAE
jgi:excisionase family DNA binding protein